MSDRSGAENLWVMRADGTAPRQVTDNVGPDEFVSPAWARDDGALYVSLYRAGRMPVDRLMSGRLTLDQINEGFDLLHEGKAIRQVVVFP